MTLTSARPLLASAATALALGLAACGGDDENDKFVDSANQVCEDSTKEIEGAAGDNEKIVTAGEEFIADLKDVDAPEDKKSDYDAWVKTQEDYFNELKAAIESGDKAAIDALDDNAGDDQAKALDLDKCLG